MKLDSDSKPVISLAVIVAGMLALTPALAIPVALSLLGPAAMAVMVWAMVQTVRNDKPVIAQQRSTPTASDEAARLRAELDQLRAKERDQRPDNDHPGRGDTT